LSFERNIAKIKLMLNFSEKCMILLPISIKKDHKRKQMALKIFCSAEFAIMRHAPKRESSNLRKKDWPNLIWTVLPF
jgi:hypothetical protein